MAASPKPALSLAELREQLAQQERAPREGLPLRLTTLDAALPDGGLPRGAVSELSSPAGLGQATRIALAACANAQAQAAEFGAAAGLNAWCAWVDASMTLYAPGVVQAGVDLQRLLIVQPPLEELNRVVVRLVNSGIFAVVIIDRSGLPGATLRSSSVKRTANSARRRPANSARRRPARSMRQRWATTVRRLALGCEQNDCSVLLLSSLHSARADRLPVALRLELNRPEHDQLQLRIVKERYGRVGNSLRIPLLSPSLQARSFSKRDNAAVASHAGR